jgi:hypothetical protein
LKEENKKFIGTSIGPGSLGFDISSISDSYRDEKLYEGSRCLELAACGLRLEACCLSLESIYKKFPELVACGLLLVARRLSLEACGLRLETGFGNSAARYKGRTSVYRMQHF